RIRSLGALLDEWTPVIPGSVLNEHPMHPITPASRALVDSAGDDLPIGWLHRSMRYGEKLATPDTSVGDLIGDVDPIRLAQGRTLGDPETIHFGLVPRTNRGVFAVNELPDLAERIQVALLNVLEERDIQVRGYQLRLPLDLLLVASANPEDYTNRGRIITPLKDRFGAEIRTHYPLDLDLELSLIRQEADLVAVVPEHVLEVLARFARDVRESPSVDPRSGVSARFAIAAAETVAAAALRRSGLLAGASAASGGGAGSAPRPEAPVARIGDTVSVTSTLRGKVEFESGEEGREIEVLAHLLRTATAETFRARLAGLDLSGFTAIVAEGGAVETGELVSSAELLRQVGTVPGLAKVLDRLGLGDAPSPEEAAAGIEFVLEGLHLTRRLGKDVTESGRTVYGDRD
ncbi:sigma 54-interacting transcriptional regulator, partial [Micromonospora sp. D75]|uniref:sigma 54-interacting transcriptional regulator n=1 Tax=Micromonospora sp. D75 TaxID=2824885 RepID=UPI001B36AF06